MIQTVVSSFTTRKLSDLLPTAANQDARKEDRERREKNLLLRVGSPQLGRAAAPLDSLKFHFNFAN